MIPRLTQSLRGGREGRLSMEENSKRETRDKLIMEALIARRLATEQEMSRIAAELESLRRQEAVLHEEIKLLDEILGAVPSSPIIRSRPEPEQVPTILSPPIPVHPESVESQNEKIKGGDDESKKRRKGLKRNELADILKKRFGQSEFSLDQVVDILLEVESGDRRKAYHAAWRTCGLLEKAKILEVISETPSGKGVKKTYKMSSVQE